VSRERPRSGRAAGRRLLSRKDAGVPSVVCERSAEYSFPEDSVQELVLIVVCESGDLVGLLLPKAAQDL
jgi:hypothetical protein